MKIVTILGTRPEIIRLSRIIPKLDEHADHVLVHTGQNFDRRLSDIFFEDLGLRAPDYHLETQSSSFGEQVGNILSQVEDIFLKEQPDRVLILGDTNSGLTSIVAKRHGIPVYHMEAGNRCFDDRVPEEVNRRIIDHSSSILLPYTSNSKAHLVREGFSENRLFVTGNPIHEVITFYRDLIDASTVLDVQQLTSKQYMLVTLHRAENVDIKERLEAFITAFSALYSAYQIPVIVSTHPRTRQKMEMFGLSADKEGVLFPDPFGFFDFIHLQEHAHCVLTDSGTVQEESCIFGVPNVTLRDVTERPETVECGSNILTGADCDRIVSAVACALASEPWTPPAEYLVPNVSDIVVKLLTSYRHG